MPHLPGNRRFLGLLCALECGLMFKVASWNLNSIRSRLTHATTWLKAILRFCRSRRCYRRRLHPWQDHRFRGRTLRRGRCLRDCAGRKSVSLVWEVCDPSYFREVMPIEAGRWGVWGVGFRLPIHSRESARRNLESILPELKSRWMEWKSRFQGGGAP